MSYRRLCSFVAFHQVCIMSASLFIIVSALFHQLCMAFALFLDHVLIMLHPVHVISHSLFPSFSSYASCFIIRSSCFIVFIVRRHCCNIFMIFHYTRHAAIQSQMPPEAFAVALLGRPLPSSLRCPLSASPPHPWKATVEPQMAAAGAAIPHSSQPSAGAQAPCSHRDPSCVCTSGQGSASYP